MTFGIKLDMGAISDVAAELGRLGADGIGQVSMQSVNEVALRAQEESIKSITDGINLPDAYVRGKFDFAPAKNPLAPLATVTASGAPEDMTPLGRYGPEQMIKPVTWTNEDLLAMGRKLVPRSAPGSRFRYTYRTGDAKRGIEQGDKSAGISVEVRRGVTNTSLAHAFSMPLRAGSVAGGNGVGVFTRSKDGKRVMHRYGPSVYQLFRRTADALADNIEVDLQVTLLANFDEEIEKITR